MDQLPLEITYKILNSCSFDDIQNLACCNRYFQKTTRSLLWKNVKIPLDKYDELKDKPLEALRNARNIIFNNNSMKVSPSGGLPMLKEILPNCDKSKLHLLSFNRIFYKDVISYALSHFDHVETLQFDSCTYLQTDSPPIDKIPTFKVLSYDNYSKFDDQIIPQNDQLEEIIIKHGCDIDSEAIKVLSEAKSIKFSNYAAKSNTIIHILATTWISNRLATL